jgi:hypothetical protein
MATASLPASSAVLLLLLPPCRARIAARRCSVHPRIRRAPIAPVVSLPRARYCAAIYRPLPRPSAFQLPLMPPCRARAAAPHYSVLSRFLCAPGAPLGSLSPLLSHFRARIAAPSHTSPSRFLPPSRFSSRFPTARAPPGVESAPLPALLLLLLSLCRARAAAPRCNMYSHLLCAPGAPFGSLLPLLSHVRARVAAPGHTARSRFPAARAPPRMATASLPASHCSCCLSAARAPLRLATASILASSALLLLLLSPCRARAAAPRYTAISRVPLPSSRPSCLPFARARRCASPRCATVHCIAAMEYRCVPLFLLVYCAIGPVSPAATLGNA